MNKEKIKHKGIVFTPPDLAQYMVSLISKKKQTILEPSCGEGSIIKFLPSYHTITGIDIDKEYINKCSINFPNVHCINSDFIDYKTDIKFDCVIGNPPYIKIQNIPISTVTKMRNEYPNYLQGNTNLYAYFLLKCFDLLKDNGYLIFLIPNSIFYNKSMEPILLKFIEGRNIRFVIDFHDTIMFSGISTYTCILYITKHPNSNDYFIKKKSINDDDKGIKVKYSYFIKNINDQPQIELFRPRIGIMTLCDNVFIIKEWVYNKNYIQFNRKGEKISYQIEKNSCRDILKISKNKMVKIIYPYIEINNKIQIDTNFKQKFPKAYNYLEKHLQLLKNRDKGDTSSYASWYAYGRTQSIKEYFNTRIFISSIVRGNIPLSKQVIITNTPLYYSGLWLEMENNIPIEKITQWLDNNQVQILNNSNVRSGGWYALSKKSFLI